MPGNKANSNGKWTQTRKVLGWRWWIHISWIQQTPTMHDFIFKPMKHIEAALAVRTWWEFTLRLEIQIILVRVSKAIYLVRLWWRRLDCRWFHVCGGMSFTLSWGATTMQVNYGEKATGALQLELLLKKLHPAVLISPSIWVVLGDYRITTSYLIHIFTIFHEFQRILGRHRLQRWSEKSSKGRMVKKRLTLEAQFGLRYLGWGRRETYKWKHPLVGWSIFVYEPCCKLSCIVSRIEVTFTQGFEGFTWKTIGDALKNDTPKT